MKKLLILLVITVICFSCKDDESPEVKLSGTYAANVELVEDELSELTFMKFQNDGMLTVETYRQIVPLGANCLTTIRKGTYTIIGNQFSFSVMETLSPDPSAFDIGGECPTEDQLVNAQGPDPVVITGVINVADSRATFDLTYNCEPQHFCPETTFSQVME